MSDQIRELHAVHGEVPVEIRLLKLTEEAGEAAEAFIGMHGLNSRKGACRSRDDLLAELADVIIKPTPGLTRIRLPGNARRATIASRSSNSPDQYSCPSSSSVRSAPMGQRCRCAEVNGSRGLGRSGPAMSALLTHPLPAVWAEQPCPMVLAANTAQVITDRPDDERDMVHRRGTEIGIGASRDDLASHDRRRLGDELAVFVDPEQALGILARGRHVELDPPRASMSRSASVSSGWAAANASTTVVPDGSRCCNAKWSRTMENFDSSVTTPVGKLSAITSDT